MSFNRTLPNYRATWQYRYITHFLIMYSLFTNVQGCLNTLKWNSLAACPAAMSLPPLKDLLMQRFLAAIKVLLPTRPCRLRNHPGNDVSSAPIFLSHLVLSSDGERERKITHPPCDQTTNNKTHTQHRSYKKKRLECVCLLCFFGDDGWWIMCTQCEKQDRCQVKVTETSCIFIILVVNAFIPTTVRWSQFSRP